jgi:NADP-dependent 3-hydroxy acid dehydrogenase YdfG
MEKLKGKNVLIAGATGSIGSATARHLAAGGANLYLLGRNTEKLTAIAAECGVPANQCIAVDLTHEQDIVQASTAIHSMIPAIDILINAIGIGIIKPFEQLTSADFDQSIMVNLKGTFLLLQAFLPAMKEQKKGLIINIPGILGKTPMAGAAAYAASKYGLNGMMKSLREELKRTDIRITQLYLGGVDSSFWDTIDLRVQRDKMILADEAAKAIWFLCQQPSSGVVSEMVIQPFNHQAI